MKHRIARGLLVSIVVFLPFPARAAVEFIQPPAGYKVNRLSLGTGNSAGVLAPDPEDENSIYAAGSFDGLPRIVRLDLRNGQWTALCDLPATVSVSGLAALRADTLFVSDNWYDHLYILRDDNPADGDFNDPGEIDDLIVPILTDPTYGWTGTAVAIVRSATNRLGLPAETVLFQSEDGNSTEGEVLAVVDPLTSPAYQPAGGAFVSGLNYGGGIVLDSRGRLVVASSFWPDTGKIWVCEDLSGNGVIESGESNIVVSRLSGTSERAGLSALAIDASDRGYSTTGWGGFGDPAVSQIQSFVVPADALNTTASVSTFATLRSPYVNAMVFNSPTRTFEPFSENGATMVIAASDDFYGLPDYLLTVRPSRSLEVREWNRY